MADRFAPRFASEAGLLILLAVAAGLADLRPALIVLVMAIAWLIVSLIEGLVWRHSQTVAWELRVPKNDPGESSGLPEGPPGWDVEEILVPADEVAAYSDPDRG